MSQLSPTAPGRSVPARADSGSSASARLGSTFRAILVSPNDGFSLAFAVAERNRKAGVRVPEGVSTYVLGAAGGAQLMLLWLTLGGLLDLRSVAAADFKWSYVVVAVVGAALLAVIAQYVWGPIGRIALSPFDAPTSSSRLRLVWGASALPQVLGLVVLLPLDLAIVGRELFTSERIVDTLPAAWAALSVALSVSLAAWSLFLFYKGVRAASGAGPWKALAGMGAAFGCLLFVTGGFLIGAVVLSGGAA